jgi:ActR/RegA family two-component response regulator
METLLIIDRDVDFLADATQLLAKSFKVTTANSVADAIDENKGMVFNAVVLDIDELTGISDTNFSLEKLMVALKSIFKPRLFVAVASNHSIEAGKAAKNIAVDAYVRRNASVLRNLERVLTRKTQGGDTVGCVAR